MGGRRDALYVGVIVLTAFGIRLAWALLVRPHVALVNDAGYYDFFGESIARGDGYVRPDGSPTAFWPVGYPAVLGVLYAVFGHSLLAAKLLNVLLDSATAGLVYLLARHWLGQRASAAAGTIYALLPGAIGFTSLTLSEPLFTFLFVLALVVLSRMRPDSGVFPGALLFGGVAAAAVYTRGQGLVLPVAAFGWLLAVGFGPRRALGYAGVAVAVVVLLAVPWSVRNSVRLGEPLFLSTNLGLNVWTGHHAGADGGLDYFQQIDFAARFQELPMPDQELAWNREGLRDGLDYALGHPAEEVRLSVDKVIRLYENDRDAIFWNDETANAPIFSSVERDRLGLLFDGCYFALGAAALAGLALGLALRAEWARAIAVVLAFWTLSHVAFFAEPRLHVPVLPLLAVLAGALAPAAAALAATLRAGRAARKPVLE